MELTFPVIKVIDENICHAIENTTDGNDTKIHSKILEYNNDNDSHIIFPTNIRYIFEDDELDEQDLNNFHGLDNDSEVENVFIIDIGSNNSLDKIQLISDKYELLSYKKNLNNQESEIANILGTELEIKVISEFKEYKHIPKKISFEELIKLYAIQNEQIEKLIDSNSI